MEHAKTLDQLDALQDELESILRGAVIGLRDGTISSDGLETLRLGYEFVRDEIGMRRDHLKRRRRTKPRPGNCPGHRERRRFSRRQGGGRQGRAQRLAAAGRRGRAGGQPRADFRDLALQRCLTRVGQGRGAGFRDRAGRIGKASTPSKVGFTSRSTIACQSAMP